MKRHKTFESITKDADVQNALRDLYDHPDKVELYPGVFCESDEKKNAEYVLPDSNRPILPFRDYPTFFLRRETVFLLSLHSVF